MAAKALESLDISLESVRAQVEEIIGRGGEEPRGHISLHAQGQEGSRIEPARALKLRHNYIGTEHILLGLIREGEGVAAQVLVKLGADLGRVREQVVHLLATLEEVSASASEGESAPAVSEPSAIRRRVNIGSGGPLEATVGYSRAVRVGDHVVVAGTTTLRPDGSTIPVTATCRPRPCWN